MAAAANNKTTGTGLNACAGIFLPKKSGRNAAVFITVLKPGIFYHTP